MTEVTLACEGLSKSYFGIPAVRDVSFSLMGGRVLGLVGENGAGKSTLMNLLGGVVTPDRGRMLIDGVPHSPRTPRDAAARGIAFIHQELNLFPNLTVGENLQLVSLPRGPAGLVSRARLRARALELLKAVELDVDPDLSLGSLSPGERQLVEIAKALATDARMIIFDEPTTSLTARECERLFALMERLRGEGRALIFISHALGDVLRVCDDVLVLRDGAVVGTGPAASFDTERLITMMVGRSLGDLFPARTKAPTTEPRLQLRGVGQSGLLSDVSLTVHAGEVVGLAGLLGAGRSELLRAIFGLDPRTAGEVLVSGKALRAEDPGESIRRGLAFVTESRRDDGLLLDGGVVENATLAALPRFAGAGGLLPRTQLHQAIATATRAVRLADDKRERDVPVRTLSGGNQQKVVLAKWWLTDPQVVLLDEPTRGVDVGAKQEIYRMVNELVEAGAGVLLVSSELEELVGLADRILVMRAGSVVGELGRPAFDRSHLLRLAFGEERLS